MTGKAAKEKIIAYCDGGSRGNPGPAALGAVIGGREYGEFLGQATNNEAEYKAVIFALKKIKQILGKGKIRGTETEIRSDSELLVKQLNGEYKILNEGLQPLFMEIWNLKVEFGKVSFLHIPREKNREADRLVNETLDEVDKRQSLL
ncbi:MAG: ribonuclease HI family protein [Patescibacteria group bacterium]